MSKGDSRKKKPASRVYQTSISVGSGVSMKVKVVQTYDRKPPSKSTGGTSEYPSYENVTPADKEKADKLKQHVESMRSSRQEENSETPFWMRTNLDD